MKRWYKSSEASFHPGSRSLCCDRKGLWIHSDFCCGFLHLCLLEMQNFSVIFCLNFLLLCQTMKKKPQMMRINLHTDWESLSIVHNTWKSWEFFFQLFVTALRDEISPSWLQLWWFYFSVSELSNFHDGTIHKHILFLKNIAIIFFPYFSSSQNKGIVASKKPHPYHWLNEIIPVMSQIAHGLVDSNFSLVT